MQPPARLFIVAVAAASLAAGLSASAATATRGKTMTVSMRSFAFAPASITVHVGDTVRWTYAETATTVPPGCEFPAFRTPVSSCPGHSVTSTATVSGHRLFDSGLHRSAGFPFSYRFTRAGTFHYFCVAHGGPHSNNPVTAMNGTVTVQP